MDDRLYAQRYRQLVERLPGVVYRASIRSGDWHYVSPAIERVLGWTPEEWRTHRAPWGTSLHEDDREAALRQEELALETRVSPLRVPACATRTAASSGSATRRR